MDYVAKEHGDLLLHVVVTAYGSSPYLTETLDSLVTNLGKDIPITVVDDGTESNDVFDKCVPFKDRIDYFRIPTNKGVSEAFNTAIRISSANFTLILGSDDLIEADPTNCVIASLKGKDIERVMGIHFGIKTINALGQDDTPLVDFVKKLLKPRVKQVRPKTLARSLAIGDWAYHPGIAWNTRWALENLYDSRLNSAMDLDLLFRGALDGRDLLITQRIVVNYRRHQGSVSSALRSKSRTLEELSVHARYRKAFARRHWWIASIFLEIAPMVRAYGLLSLFSKEQESVFALVKAIFLPNKNQLKVR